MTWAPTSFVTGMDSPVTIEFVERGAAFQHRAVDGNFVARAHAQCIADLHDLERDLFVAAVGANAARGLGREIEQRADGAGGRRARAQFEHLADQHQHGDHRGGFEINRRRAAVAAEGGREYAGREGGGEAVDVGDAGAHGDQREHVEIARDQRLRAAHEKRPARPQHHRRGEGELDVIGDGGRDPMRAEMAAHLDDHHRQREREANPEAPRHVGELGIGAGVGCGHFRFERHAADRAGAGAGLADLRDASGRCRSRLRPRAWVRAASNIFAGRR